MDPREMIEACQQHSLFSWSAGATVDPLPVLGARGVWLFGPDGQKWLDFNSQLMSVNIGHSHPRVVEAMKTAADGLLYAYPGAATEPRARLSQRLAELCPGDIDAFFFTLGGAEANENAVRAAQLYTGRKKILARYRSYHGGTNAMLQLTGDPRRWANEPGMPGVVHVMDPQPYTFEWGADEDEITRKHLIYLDEVIQYEGPQTIAAMILETVVGTNGILIPPRGWLKGLRALLDKYGILLICDEVMAGFGRTGKLFAFEHFDVIPDLVTMAKGLTSSYVPLGAVGMRRHIADHFQKNVFWGGLTYHAHAYCCAVALACVDALIDDGMIENAARLDPVLRAHHARLKARHPCVRTHRNIGLFGILELQKNRAGERLAPYNGAHPAMGKLGRFFRENGLFTLLRWDNVMTNPPLCITEAELDLGFEILDRGLEIVDAAMED